MSENTDEDFKVGDKAWIKLPGYPHWPGRIEEPKNIRERKKVRPGFFLVFFFGTHETAICAVHELYQWNEENNKKFFVERDTVYFTDSLWEVENDPNVKRDAPVPAITKPPDLENVSKYNPIVPATFSDGEGPAEDQVPEDAKDSSDPEKSGSSSSDPDASSSSSSSSSSDSDFEKRRKTKKKTLTKKKARAKTSGKKVKVGVTKKPQVKSSSSSKSKSAQNQKKTPGDSSSSSDSTVDDVDVSSSSDEESIAKFKKLTSTAKPPAPRTSAAIIPKPLSAKKPDKPKSPTKPKTEIKKEGGSSDEEAALKKFAAAENKIESGQKAAEEPEVKVKQIESADEKAEVVVNQDEGNSSLAAFLSESDSESKQESKRQKSPDTKKSYSSSSRIKTEGSVGLKSPKISSKLLESGDVKDDQSVSSSKSEPMEVSEKSPISGKKRPEEKEQDEDSDSPPSKKRERSPQSSSNQLEKKLKRHKEKMERQKQIKEQMKEESEKAAVRKPLIEESDNSSNEEDERDKSRKSEQVRKMKSAIIMDAHKLSSDRVLDKLHFELMRSLTQKSLNHERAVTCLTEMKDYLTSENLKKVSDVFTTIKKIRKYKKDVAVQQKAEEIFNSMKSLVSHADSEVINKLVEEKKKRHSEAAKPHEGAKTDSETHAEVKSVQTEAAEVNPEAAKETTKESQPKESEVLLVQSQATAKTQSEKDEHDSKLPTEANKKEDVSDLNSHQETDEKEVEKEEENPKPLVSASTKPAVQYFFLRGSEPDPGSGAGLANSAGGVANVGEDSSQSSTTSSVETNGHAKRNPENPMDNGPRLTPTLDEASGDTMDCEQDILSSETKENNNRGKEGDRFLSEKQSKVVDPAIDIDSELGI